MKMQEAPESLTKELNGLTLNRGELQSPNSIKFEDSIFPRIKPALLEFDGRNKERFVPKIMPVFAGKCQIKAELPCRNLYRTDSFSDSGYVSPAPSPPPRDEEMRIKPVFENFVRSNAEIDFDSDEGFEPESPIKTRIVAVAKFVSPVKFAKCRKHLLKDSPSRISTGKIVKPKPRFSPVKVAPSTGLDFIAEFEARGMIHLVKNVFGRMDGGELHKLSGVSRRWRQICSRAPYTDLVSNFRASQIKLAKSRVHPNFNRSPNYKETALLTSRSSFDNRERRLVAPSAEEAQSSPSTRMAERSTDPKLKHWLTVKRNLLFGESMIPCPRCQYPARRLMSNKGCCSLVRCGHEFCCLCKGEWHLGPCPAAASPLTTSSSPRKPQRAKTLKKKLKKL